MKLKEKKKINIMYLVLFVILITRLLSGKLESEINITFLDVGQGSGVCIRVNASKAVMIDGGSSSEKNINEYIITPYLKSEGIKEITHWFVSHSDLDHVSGLLEFLEDYQNSLITIDSIVLPAFRLDDDKYDLIIKLANKNHIRIINISAGDSIKYHSDYGEILNMYCLSPSRAMAYNDDEISFKDHNDESEVLYFSYGEFDALMLGDLPLDYDSYLIEEMTGLGLDSKKVEVVEASHHGSKTGTSEDLLNYIKPDYCIISAGENNSYGHPNSELLHRLTSRDIKYFVTYESGAVILNSDQKHMWIKTMF